MPRSDRNDITMAKAATATATGPAELVQQTAVSDASLRHHINDNHHHHNSQNNEESNVDRTETTSPSFSRIDQQLDFLTEHPLHPIVETVLAWIVAMLCLVYYGYQFVSLYLVRQQRQQVPRRIPLMTEANVQNSKTRADPILQLQQLHQQISESLESIVHADALSTLLLRTTATSGGSDKNDTTTATRDTVIHNIRNNATLRRQVSQYTMIMTSIRQPSGQMPNPSTTTILHKPTTHLDITAEMTQLYEFFDSIWSDLLRLPSISSSSPLLNATTYPFVISVVIPIFQECGRDLVRATLSVAHQHCHTPNTVQIIIVDAGQCRNVHVIHEYITPSRQNNNNHQNNWGEILYLSFAQGFGRGSCMNYGAQHARGRYVTFLHSDTLLPYHWDVKVRTTLDRTSHKGTVVTHACSFSVGHNVSKEGLGTTLRYPYGIRSILLLGNIRAWLFRLPYGDHILSFHTVHFHYIGGFPHQPIMEDYAIMDLLRQRAAVVPNVETLRIIPPPTGLCSVRRWQMHGVVYVTLVNALLVHRYAYGGWTADDVYSYYYLRPLKQKTQ